MKNYLLETNIIDYSDLAITALAKELKQGCTTDLEIAKNCFNYVRDEISHTGDIELLLKPVKS